MFEPSCAPVPLPARRRAPRNDPRLPPCPLCGAAALESAYRFAEDLSHDCDCLRDREEEYYRGLRRLWRGRVCLEQFLAGVPRRYRGFTLEGYVREPANAEALAAARVLGPGEFAYLYGPPGRGKTRLAVAAARRLAAAGHKALFLGEAEYLEAIYRAIRGQGEAPDYRTAEVVVLDDAGKIKPTDFAYQTLYALLEHFSSEGKTLLVTSNYPPLQLARRLAGGEAEAAAAIASRLTQGYVLEVGGRDHRAAAAQGPLPPGG